MTGERVDVVTFNATFLDAQNDIVFGDNGAGLFRRELMPGKSTESAFGYFTATAFQIDIVKMQTIDEEVMCLEDCRETYPVTVEAVDEF